MLTDSTFIVFCSFYIPLCCCATFNFPYDGSIKEHLILSYVILLHKQKQLNFQSQRIHFPILRTSVKGLTMPSSLTTSWS